MPMVDILFSDDILVAVNKPSGLLVHRTALANDRDTVMTRLRDALGRWVYPLHRLDRGTSGVLLFALDPETAAAMAAQFAERAMEKRYLTVVRGYAPETGRIDSPLAEEERGMPVDAITEFSRLATIELPIPIGRYPTARYSLLEVTPFTGRTHQIRRHMAHIRHPVVGDIVHGEGRHNRLFRERFDLHRLLLHARSLAFAHPRSGEHLELAAPLPDELAELFARFGWKGPEE